MIDFGTMTTLVSFLVELLIGLPIGWVFIGATILGLTVTGTCREIGRASCREV